MKRFLLAALVALWPAACGGGGSSDPEPELPTRIAGFSFLGIESPTTNCDEVMAGYEGASRIVLAYLDQSFGDNRECTDRLLDDPRPKIFNVYLTNGSGRRKRILRETEFLNRYSVAGLNRALERNNQDVISQIQMRVTKLNERYSEREDLRLIITPELEDNLRDEAAETFRKAIQSRHYGEVWRNPNGRSGIGNFDGLELHNVDEFQIGDSPCAWSNDGYDLEGLGGSWNMPRRISKADLLARVRRDGECLTYVWSTRFNGLDTDTQFAPPVNRRLISISQPLLGNLNQLLLDLENLQ